MKIYIKSIKKLYKNLIIKKRLPTGTNIPQKILITMLKREKNLIL